MLSFARVAWVCEQLVIVQLDASTHQLWTPRQHWTVLPDQDLLGVVSCAGALLRTAWTRLSADGDVCHRAYDYAVVSTASLSIAWKSRSDVGVTYNDTAAKLGESVIVHMLRARCGI